MDEVTIREMKLFDVPWILKIESISFSTPWSKLDFLNEISNPFSITKVALRDSEVVGYICVNCIIDEGHILNLAVHPDTRRKGIATGLVEKVLDELRKKMCKFLYLEVRVSNIGAIRFYESFGFVSTGIRKEYYTLPREDAVIMMLEL
jgi:ribosomal-protein-alanine N-acetyltransferase